MPTSSLTPQELKQRLLAGAHELGFSLAGVTTPDPPPHIDVYEDWLAAGRHGKMEYLARERNRRARHDPRALLPECESILVVGINYLPNDAERGPAPPARVSNYAVGDDYHDVIPTRLEQLMEQLQGWVGGPIPYRVYTDTGAILERDLAQRAGLGWIGKNTCLIDPQRGSYFFLAEVLIGLSLPPDQPFRSDHCGSCTRCLVACPTGCIRPDRTLDADRCLSYLTIELREEIPIELRPEVGSWVYGCDICQQVCPWNIRFAEPTDEPAFQARPFFLEAGLSDYLQLDDPSYQQNFRGSPMKRAKRWGLARNAAVAAGNHPETAPLAALIAALADPEPIVRRHAAWALGELNDPLARDALRSRLELEADENVMGEILRALDQ